MDQKTKHDIIKLSDQSFGINYFTFKDLNHSLASTLEQVFTEKENNSLGGFSLVQIHNRGSIRSLLGISKKEMDDLFPNAQWFGYRKMTAVHTTLKGKGISKRLFRQGNNWLFESGVEIILTSYWQNETNKHYQEFLVKNGFSEVLYIPSFWKKDSLERKFICPTCGVPPCNCAATIYAKYNH